VYEITAKAVQGRKVFFSEEKKQKTFFCASRVKSFEVRYAAGTPVERVWSCSFNLLISKVFCFFSSEKKALLSELTFVGNQEDFCL
jgi:hypothetical protein